MVPSCLDAIDAIASVINSIPIIRKLSHGLNIKVEFPIKNGNILLLTAYNNTDYDNEIESVNFYKGRPSSALSSIFYSLDLQDCNHDTNPNTGNIIVPKRSHVEISIPCQCIACNYANIGEAIGKPYDKIYLAVRDRRGKIHHKNTGQSVDFFRILGKQGKTENHR